VYVLMNYDQLIAFDLPLPVAREVVEGLTVLWGGKMTVCAGRGRGRKSGVS
jgi:hypothetical protein